MTSTTATHRLIALAFAAIAATGFAACGELEAPAQNIGQAGPAKPDPTHDRDGSISADAAEQQGQAQDVRPYGDPRPCTPDPDIARKEHRPLCAR